MRKRFFSILIVCLSLALLAACGSDESNSGDAGGSGEDGNGSGNGEESSEGGDTLLAKIKEEGVVTVGFSNEAPYAYKDDEGNLTGAAVEVARAVFNEMGAEVEGQLLEWGQLIPGVKTGKLDVITAGMAINPDRCEEVAFGNPSVVYGEGIIVPKGNPMDLHSYEDIRDSDAKVAVLNGGTEQEFLKEVGVSEENMMPVPSVSEGFSAVKTGRADVTTATELTVKKAIQDSGGDELEYVEDFIQPDIPGVPSYGAAGFSKSSDALREEYNKTLEELRDSGKIEEVITSLPLWDENNLYEGSPTTEELCSGEGY